MLSKGQAEPGELLNVLTTYGPPDAPWGWRTVITVVGPDAISIQAYNIPHGREAYVAIETKLQRT